MITMAVTGMVIGALMFSLIVHWFPPRTSPVVRLGRFDARQAARPEPSLLPELAASTSGWADVQARIGAVLTGALTRRGIAYTSLRQDLALTSRSMEAMMGRKIASALAGFVLVTGTAAVAQATSGIGLPANLLTFVAIAAAVGFFFLPDLEARQEATARRRDFRRALGAYLDLVALEMAGSAAPAEALPNAARVGAGWPLVVLRDTLFRATLAGQDHWGALAELGTRVGVSELNDLATIVRLVGHDGARVRATLTARAATLRRRELAEAEGLAGQRDQSMVIAQILIGFGFVVFLAYPAIVNVIMF